MQYRVICPEADFSEIGLDKHVKDDRIEIASPKEEGNDEKPSTPVT